MHSLKMIRAGVLAMMLAGGSVGCGSINLPIDLALVGDNDISITLPTAPNQPLSTTLNGGVETTIGVDIGLFSLLNPNGIQAVIAVDDLLIVGDNIPVLGGAINTGTLCIEQNAENPGGGVAALRLLQGEADFQLALNTIIRPTDEGLLLILEASGADPFFAFDAEIETTEELAFADLFGLLLGGGGGGGGLELNQELTTTLPPDTPLFGGAEVVANLTLASVDAIPVHPLMADCVTP